MRGLTPFFLFFMRVVFRHRDYTLVSYYHQLVEGAGIQTLLRNQHLTMTGLSEIPIPEFYPNICVLDDRDYEEAWTIIDTAMSENTVNADQAVTCPACSEINPGNFDFCF